MSRLVFHHVKAAGEHHLAPGTISAAKWVEAQGNRVVLETVSKTRDRSNEQNRLMWTWNKEASDHLGDMSPTEVHYYSKVYFGVPILRRDDAEFDEIWRRCFAPLSVETQQEAMSFVDVTSKMGVKQMTEYLNTVSAHWFAQGVALTCPEER